MYNIHAIAEFVVGVEWRAAARRSHNPASARDPGRRDKPAGGHGALDCILEEVSGTAAGLQDTFQAAARTGPGVGLANPNQGRSKFCSLISTFSAPRMRYLLYTEWF